MATRKPGTEPGGSEFSHGKGLMSPLDRDYIPEGYETLRAYWQVDSVDPEAELDYNPTRPRQDHKDITNPTRETGKP